MATKTQEIFDKMNYFLDFKQSHGQYCDAYSYVCRLLSELYANRVANGLCTEDDIEKFKETLPGTSAIFDYAEMHDDLSFAQSYFVELVKVHSLEMNQEHAKSR